jgi:hypothetical protein
MDDNETVSKPHLSNKVFWYSAVLLTIFVFYPLSFGPVTAIAYRVDCGESIVNLYVPVLLAARAINAEEELCGHQHFCTRCINRIHPAYLP